MAGISAVGIDDDFAAGQAGIAHRAADGEAAGRIDQESGILVHQLGRNGFADHLINDGGGKRLMADFGRVLGRNDDRIDANGLVPVVLDRHLTLSVRAQPRQFLTPARLRKAARDAVRQRDGHGHHLGRFIAGKAEHHALIAGADVHIAHTAPFQRVVNTHGDIRALTMHRRQHGTGMAVKAVFGAVIADIADHFANDIVHSIVGGGGHLAHHHHNAGCRAGFAGHAGIRILRQNRVEHRVADLVADFVGMSFRNGFGCKQLLHLSSPLA